MASDKVSVVENEGEQSEDTISVTSAAESSNIFVMPQAPQQLSASMALMNFIKSNIGSGMLSMPVVLRYCGLWTGLSLILLAGSLSTYLMHVLLRTSISICERHALDRSKLDYTETVFQVLKHGPVPLRRPKGKIKHTVNLFLIITQIGFACVYTLFITENTRYFLKSLFPDLTLNFYLVGFLVCICLIPMCMFSDMQIYAYISIIANVATVLGMLLIFAYLFTTGLKPISSLPAYTDFFNFLIGFSVVMYSFEGISLVLPIANKMKNPETYGGCVGVLSTGMLTVVCLNALVAFFGYLKFGDKAEGSITLNTPEKPYWFAPIKPLFILTIVVTYILQFYVPASIFERLMEKLRCHREASDTRRYVHLKFMRVCLVMFAYIMVITIPKLDLMISLIGSLASSFLAFILPPALEIVHLWEERYTIRGFWIRVFAKHMCIIFIGFVCFIGGTVATIIQLVESFAEHRDSLTLPVNS